MESFWPKIWVTSRTKILAGIPSNWRIFESNWLDIESQIVNLTQNILKLLGIPGRILVLLVTQILGQNDSIFSFSTSLQSFWETIGVTRKLTNNSHCCWKTRIASVSLRRFSLLKLSLFVPQFALVIKHFSVFVN